MIPCPDGIAGDQLSARVIDSCTQATKNIDMQKAELLKVLSNDAMAIRLKKGEYIIREGAAPLEGLGFILAGSARVIQKQGEHEVLIGRIEAGHFFGETSLLLQRPRIASVKADSDDCVVIFIGAKNFQLLASSNYQFLEMLTGEAIHRIEGVLATLARLRVKNPLAVDPSLIPIIQENRVKCLQLQQMLNNTRASWIGNDKPLFSQGDKNDGLTHLVVQGAIRLTRSYEDTEYEMTTMQPGDLLGYSKSTTSPIRRYSAVPVGESARVISFDDDLLFRILRLNQELFFYVFRTIITTMVMLDDSLRIEAVKLSTAPGTAKTDEAIMKAMGSAPSQAGDTEAETEQPPLDTAVEQLTPPEDELDSEDGHFNLPDAMTAKPRI